MVGQTLQLCLQEDASDPEGTGLVVDPEAPDMRPLEDVATAASSATRRRGIDVQVGTECASGREAVFGGHRGKHLGIADATWNPVKPRLDASSPGMAFNMLHYIRVQGWQGRWVKCPAVDDEWAWLTEAHGAKRRKEVWPTG